MNEFNILDKKSTIFDKILSKEIPAKVAFENEHVFSFYDTAPQSPVHVLVIPKKKIDSLSQVSEQHVMNMGRFIQGIALTARALNLEENGYRVVINNGRDAQQTVDYLHAHILAGRSLKWPPG